MKTSARAVALVLSYALATVGCHEPLDTTRTSSDTGTFGQTVVGLVCQRIAYLEDLTDGGKVDVRGDTYRDTCRLGLAAPGAAPGALKALLAKYDELVAAVDTMFPDGFLDTLQGYLTSNEFLATYDDGTATDAVDALIGLLRLMADDDDATAALERLNVRLGYKPLTPALGAVRTAVNYPELHQLLLVLSQAITPGGGARTEWEHLIDALGVTLRNAEVSTDPADPQRTARLAVDLLLGEQGLLGTSRTVPLARRDTRGVAEPAALGGLFVDMDNDGRADTNALGQFVDASGQVLAAPTPFQLPEGSEDVPWPYRDAQGRALDSDGGALLYRYVDVDKTMLSALARDGVQLFDPTKGTALDLLRGASALLGGRQQVTRAYDDGESLSYRGYTADQSPLLDMLFGYLQILRDPAIYDTLDLAKTLLVDHEPQVAQLAEAIVSAGRLADAHPEAGVPADAPLWDDLVPVIKQIVDNQGLTTALLEAMERPEIKQLADRFEKFMVYKDRFDIDPDTQQVVGTFTTPVDRGAADSAFNRSVFQRILHLINDSNHTVMCNKQDAKVIQFGITLATYDRCDLVQVDNLAVLFLQSIAYAKDAQGRYICENDAGDQTRVTTNPAVCGQNGERIRPGATLNFNWGGLVSGAIDVLGGDAYVEQTADIQGFRTHPTPQALVRALFWDTLNLSTNTMSDTMEPVRDREGDLYSTQHIGTLPVWELEGFYDQIRPIVQAFYDNHAEQLFVDFMSALHKHWPTTDSVTHQSVDPSAPGYVYGSGAMSYEPLIIDILDAHKLMDALVDVAPTLDAVTVNGKPYATVARNAARYILSPQAGLADRLGNTTSTTADGRAVATLSPWQILADAYSAKHARMAEVGGEGTAWVDSVAELIDILARGQDVPTLGWRFKNPRFRGVAVALIDFLEARVARHDQLGDRVDWLSTQMPGDLEDALTGPVMAGAADFVLSLQAEPETREQLEKLMQYLVDEVTYGDAFDTTVTAAADLLQLAVADDDLAPIARVVGEALRPERGWLDAHLTFVRKAREADTNQALVQMLINMYDQTAAGRTAIGDLIDGVSEVHRARPYDDLGARYTADDYRALLHGVADFLDEKKRGLRKFIAIIQDRNL
ncbi:MAG: hypothetical protein H6709_15785 [Kofleriaceae bacterium]|nr:hypothetical protein [Myxococcales bacterium]MCB9564880.1 hypothetical protein [Kofleriaceae bacterium]MCB9573540.1 hypothetical protein [Kofleriaceae bacterium]